MYQLDMEFITQISILEDSNIQGHMGIGYNLQFQNSTNNPQELVDNLLMKNLELLICMFRQDIKQEQLYQLSNNIRQDNHTLGRLYLDSKQFLQDKRIQLGRSKLSRQYLMFPYYDNSIQLHRSYIPRLPMWSNIQLDKR